VAARAGIGIIGLGIMGTRMLAHFEAHEGFHVVAAWDPSAEACRRAVGQSPHLRLAASAQAVARAHGVDCLYIASPPSAHLGHIALGLDAGRAVLCEKPLALDGAQSRALVERVEAAGARAGVNFPQASSPALRTVAAMLAEQQLGPLEGLEIDLAFPAWPEAWQVTARWLALRAEGGFVREVVTHMAFLARRLLGPLEVESCAIAYPPDGLAAETGVEARLRAGGLPVTLRGIVAAGVEERTDWTLRGRDGACRIHDWYSLARREGAQPWTEVDLWADDVRAAAYRAQLDALRDLVAGRPSTIATLREGFEVQQCIERLIGLGGAGT
jgi:predicted dehydrogenase